MSLPKEIKDHLDSQIKNGKEVKFPDSRINHIVEREYKERKKFYNNEVENLRQVWGQVAEKVLPELDKLYGSNSIAPMQLKFVPTAYGTGGGSLDNGGIVYFRMPKFGFKKIEDGEQRDKKRELYGTVHEILCHEATAHLRRGTSIEDSINATKQLYKERLMDLLGRTLLVRSGLLKRDEVIMDEETFKEIGSLIDDLYYKDSQNQDENQLKFEGDLHGLINAIIKKLEEL